MGGGGSLAGCVHACVQIYVVVFSLIFFSFFFSLSRYASSHVPPGGQDKRDGVKLRKTKSRGDSVIFYLIMLGICLVKTVILMFFASYFISPMLKQKTWPTLFLLLCSKAMEFTPF